MSHIIERDKDGGIHLSADVLGNSDLQIQYEAENLNGTLILKPILPERQTTSGIVAETFGVIKNLDRETVIRLAEDKELCGY